MDDMFFLRDVTDLSIINNDILRVLSNQQGKAFDREDQGGPC